MSIYRIFHKDYAPIDCKCEQVEVIGDSIYFYNDNCNSIIVAFYPAQNTFFYRIEVIENK